MQEAYASNLFAVCPRLFGLKLRPFSLGHSLILDAIRSPLVTGAGASTDDLMLGVVLCSMSFADGCELVRSGKMPIRYKLAALRCGLSRQATQDAAYDALAEYLEGHSATPERWETGEGKGGGTNNQWQFVLHGMIGRNLSTPDQAESLWDMPLGMAFCYAFARSELDGDSQVVSEDDAQVMGIAV